MLERVCELSAAVGQITEEQIPADAIRPLLPVSLNWKLGKGLQGIWELDRFGEWRSGRKIAATKSSTQSGSFDVRCAEPCAALARVQIYR